MTDAQIVEHILSKEGGFVDHPADRGGPTNLGITQTTLAAWRKQPVTVADVQQLSAEEARAIYQALYVTPFDGADPRVKAHLVDIAVHSGVSRARALLATAEQHQDRPLPVQLVIERLEFIARLVQQKPSQLVFLAGWIRRAVSHL
jgi:lysozyme family protein